MPAARTTWADRWKRLTAMDRAEFLDRVRQQALVRADALRYRARMTFGEGAADFPPLPKRFFFAAQSASSLCSFLKKRLPGTTDAILRQAGKICEHRFDLLGYEDLLYSTPIAWHSDLVHKKQAPREPWHKIHYLDFNEVGDSKVTWELSRHQHFVTLAKAFRLSGDVKFAQEIFAQWQDWHVQNPYPIGINWASSLEVAFRCLSWIWTYFLLEDSPAMPSGFRHEWLRALSVGGRHIECYLSTYFSPNTHLLGEGVALFFIGTTCPELQSAKRWQQLGWKIVTQEAGRQVQPDGLHFEQSTYYHVYALDFFLHAGILANLNALPVPPAFDATLEKMLNALCLLTRAGIAPRFGDDDGGRLFDARRNRPEHMTDPLATGAVLFGRGDFKTVAGDLREETLWLLGEEGAAEFDRLPGKSADTNSIALPSAGLYFMTGNDQQLVIDAGPHGASSAGHGHADALSICLNMKGAPLLIDPGTCEYVGEERRLFRCTASHNTLMVDGKGQAQPKGPFSWTRLPEVRSEGWITGQTFDLFAGSHDGYRPVIHRRWVFWLRSKFCLVRDHVSGAGEHTLDVFWHLHPDLLHKNDVFSDHDGKHSLRVLGVEGDDAWRRVVRPGWWSPVYGKKEPAPVLHFSTVAKLPAEFVTLLLPGAAESTVCSFTRRADTDARVYLYESADEKHCMVFGRRGESWAMPPWSSDAEFMYLGWQGNRKSLILCNAHYLELGGKKVISSAVPTLRCEILVNEEDVDVVCSDQNTVVMKDAIRTLWAESDAGSKVPASKGTVS